MPFDQFHQANVIAIFFQRLQMYVMIGVTLTQTVTLTGSHSVTLTTVLCIMNAGVEMFITENVQMVWCLIVSLRIVV